MPLARPLDAPAHLPSADELQAALQVMQGGPLRAGASPALPPLILERLETAEATARAQAEAFNRNARRTMERLSAGFSELQARHVKKFEALKRLRQMAAEFSQAAKPYSACRKACTHCCHIPVAVYPSEARVMGKALGREPAVVEKSPRLRDKPYGYDQPCTFLQEGACAIYEHRPLACRVHINLDADELLCALIPGESVPVPLANATSFYALYAKICEGEALADVREYFPAS